MDGGNGMRYGLIGGALGHSYSKPIHERLGGYPYELIELGDAAALQAFMEARDFDGVNVTIPYKREVMPYCDRIDPRAQRIGAVNTLVNRDGVLSGYNTDYDGLLYLLQAHGITLAGKRVLILGNGGTCRTISALAEDLGAVSVAVASRHPGPGALSYAEAAGLADVQVIFNASPAGMYPHNGECLVDFAHYPRCEAAVDMIYNPLRTAFLQRAAARGVKAVNGLEMLVAQAQAAAALFLNRALPGGEVPRLARQLRGELANIVLSGMPTCGKSTGGGLLAERFTKPLVDVDEQIVRRAGMSIPDLFRRQGEEAFRDLETACVREAAQKTGQIISTGGGVIKRKENIEALRENGVLFFLDRPLRLLTSDDTRPLSSSREAVSRLYRERYERYRSCCDARIPNAGTPEEAAAQIEERYDEIMDR